MIKELKSKYVETAEAKGISKKQIIFKHAFKNANHSGNYSNEYSDRGNGGRFSLVENVFALPGLGILVD